MSADNWDKCVKCGRKHGPSLFREDCDYGILNGVFYITYKGKCEECGFEHNFKHEGPIK